MDGLRRLRFNIITVVLAAGCFTARPVFALGGNREQADAAALIAQAQELLQAGNSESLKALAVEPGSLGWLDSQRRRVKWKLALLPMPGKSPGDPLAVFHDFHTCESIGDHIHRLVKTSAGWRFGPEIPETETLGFRVRDHAITVRYDLPTHGCVITDEIEVERLGDEKIGILRLSADMSVDSIKRNGKPFPAELAPGAIAFEAPPEKRFKLQFAYHGTVYHPETDYILPSEAVLVSYWYPHVARLPAKLGVTVTVPKGWTAVGQGELLAREEKGEETVFRFRNEVPTSYFSLDAGPYKITTRESGGRKFSICELRSGPSRAEKALDEAIRSLEFYEHTFGKYPYTHYEVVETLQPFGGALEAYSFATFQSGTIPGAIPHEVAHSWWGGVVPNPYTSSMWNESFASYSDGLYHRKAAGGARAIAAPPETPLAAAGPRALQGMHSDPNKGRGMLESFRVPINQATDTSNPAHGSVGYGKGSMVLAMLEDLLGTDMMIRCMRRFYRDHKPGEAADWPDFERAVRNETGTDYAWFFEQWTARGGVPRVRMTDVSVSSEGTKSTVRGRVIQEGPAYRLRIPVAIETGGGAAWREVEVTGASSDFKLTVDGPVKSVKLDPAGNILMAGEPAAIGGGDPFTYTRQTR